jgi:hypothetical protein|uniref:PKD domain-containing protein n=1 Tax=Candidatus Planktophila sp. TaxID=2175601 RepID=UPI004048F2F5
MKKLLVICALLIALPQPLWAADCNEKACIDVYTQDGKIVIEGRKGTGPKSSEAVTPKPAATQKPTPKPSQKPQVTPTQKPKVLTTKKPVVVKPRTVKKPTPGATRAATSLSDKLVEMLPTAGIAYSPSFQPLIKVPVFFWSDVPEVINKKISIVGEVVEVQLKPTFIWHYGDGVIYPTRKVGAPYPDGEIQHSYSNPGHYLIELITIWSGEFTVQGVKARIPGDIKTVSVLPITVVAAPSRFTSPVNYLR